MALDDLYGHMVGLAARVLRQNCVMPRTLNADYAANLVSDNGTVDVPIPADIAIRQVTPGPVSPGAPRPVPTTIPVTLSEHWEAPFSLTDRDITSMENSKDYMPAQLQKAAAALANKVDSSLFDIVYPEIYGWAGTAGTTPFATSLVAAQDAMRVLIEQDGLFGEGMDHITLDPSAYVNAVGFLVNTPRFDAAGQEAMQRGRISEAMGFQWHQDRGVPRHVNPNGTPVNWLVNSNAHAAGATSVPIDTGTNNPVRGDIFSVAGSTQTYTVKSFAGGVLTYAPAAPVAFADNAAITFRAAHRVNLVYNRDVAAFASRPMKELPFHGGNVIMSYVDDESGLVFRLEIRREHYQVGFYVSAMWGGSVVLPALACRIGG